MALFQLLAITLLSLNLVRAHTVIVYPGYRGNNLQTNGTVEETNGLGAAEVNGSYAYPYGMEWIYPCGGMPTSTNRTKWPIAGGAVAVQPGWFPGHQEGFIYMNMGFGTIPPNMSNPMIKPFGIVGPTNNPYPGTFCLPQVPLPSGFTAHMGGHATIQVVLAAKHGAALYNVCFPFSLSWGGWKANEQCVDIEFADPKDVPEVTRENCFNSSDITFQHLFTTTSLQSGTTGLRVRREFVMQLVPLVVMGAFVFMM